MGLKNQKLNFTDIKSIVDAGQALQDAGKQDDCNKIMSDLAEELKEATK